MPSTISSCDNSRIKQVVKLLSSSRFRRESGLFVAEGLRLCLDAYTSGCEVETALYTSGFARRFPAEWEQLCDRAEESFLVEDKAFHKAADTLTPQGILLVCRQRKAPPKAQLVRQRGYYLLLEDVQDPGNLGTAARAGEALGLNALILSPGCCDVYNPKALRASMGAFFRLPVLCPNSLGDALKELKNLDIPLCAAVVEETAEPVQAVDFAKGGAVVIGNEGNGLTKQTIEKCNRKVTIPMRGRAESLNASSAATIFLWEMLKNSHK